MYKIQLFDLNSYPAFVSGVVEVYTDDIDEFEEHYLIQNRASDDQKARFLRSKSGEIVTDYYSDEPELNIVQEINVEILHTKQEIYEDIEVVVHAGSLCEYHYWFKKLVFDIRWVRIENGIEKIVKTQGFDCYEKEWGSERPIAIVVCGNPFWIVRGNASVGRWGRRKHYECSGDRCGVGDEIESYVWHPVDSFETEEAYIEDLAQKMMLESQMERALKDLPGDD